MAKSLVKVKGWKTKKIISTFITLVMVLNILFSTVPQFHTGVNASSGISIDSLTTNHTDSTLEAGDVLEFEVKFTDAVKLPGYPLDSIGDGVLAAYSLRKLKDSYSGSSIRVRRGDDDVEQDIGFVDGQLDIKSLLDFANGQDVYIHTWYDQSGNEEDLVRENKDNQTRIISDGDILLSNEGAVTEGSGVPEQQGDEMQEIEVDGVSYVIQAYTQVGSSTFTPPAGVSEVDVLVVGGGGGGGGVIGGGGGAGGLIFNKNKQIAELSYSITVGEGGQGGSGWNTASQDGKPGENSTFGSLIALGGGGGYPHDTSITGASNTNTAENGGDGGSGGGEATDDTGEWTGKGLQSESSSVGFGNDGGGNGSRDFGGGGGGAGSKGYDVSSGKGGNGGSGLLGATSGGIFYEFFDVFGNSYGEVVDEKSWFAGGGGGGVRSGSGRIAGTGGLGGGGSGTSSTTKAEDGVENTGGGGGAAGYNSGLTDRLGGNSGSGIVLIRYRLSDIFPVEELHQGDITELIIHSSSLSVADKEELEKE